MSMSMFALETHESISDIGEEVWGSLHGPEDPPFLSYPFLDALERTGCVRPERGWLPMHMTLRRGAEVVAAAPGYVKGNSEGEFVFDHSWARFAYDRLGVAYYPKLLVAAPFTPATGPRLLVRPGEDESELRRAFASGLSSLLERTGLSSAHVLFSHETEARALAEAGMAHRQGLQYHWRNAGYATFDDFLSRFNSKRRNQLRRERREVARQGTRIEGVTGSDLTPEVVDAAFTFYLSTIHKYFWGRQYLSREFFEEICSRIPQNVLIVLARDAASKRPIAGAFNLVSNRALYGRYWGATEERPFLHFNVCYYQGIEECIARGLEVFEPGAGGEHKLVRGFEPTITHSLHLLSDSRLDSVIRDYVERERDAIAEHQAHYQRSPVLRGGA